MFLRYAKFVQRFRFVILAFWLCITCLAVFLLPNLNEVVAHKQTNFLPSDNPVVVAGNLLNRVNPQQAANSTAVIAIRRASGLTSQDERYFRTHLQNINENRAKYGVTYVQGAFNTTASVASAFHSKDKTTEIAIVGFFGDAMSKSATDALTDIKNSFTNTPRAASILFTGDVPIQSDQVAISQAGAEKTAGVTVVLVLVILLIVFRSAVAPLVTLVSIGLSFMLSSKVVAFLGAHGMPISTFTTTFLIAILFGAGTDYSIIILNRYREELGSASSREEALASSLQAVSKTVIFSSLTVLVSFAVLYFANFGLYRTAVGVAVGIFITLAACLTFIPALMTTFGRFLFWPRKVVAGVVTHKPSRIWGATSSFATRRPWWTLLALVVVLLPVALLFTNDRTFDPMEDIPTAPSVAGFHQVAGAFGQGRVLPMTIVLQTPHQSFRSSAGLSTIENVSKAVANQSSVQEVDSATRPTGVVISQFQLTDQNQEAAKGLDQVHSGLQKLGTHLQSASSSIGQNSSQVGNLVSGANQVASGASQMHGNLAKATTSTAALSDGASQVSQGAAELQNGLSAFKTGASKTNSGAAAVAEGVSQAASQSSNLVNGANQLSTGNQQLSAAANQLANAVAAYEATHPLASADPSFQQIAKLASGIQSGSSKTAAASKQVAAGTSQLSTSLNELSTGAGSVATGTQRLATSASSLASGAKGINTGASQVSTGATKLQNGLSELTSGSAELANGSQQVASGVGTLSSSTEGFGGGLRQTVSAIHDLNNGVDQVSTALKNSQQATKTGNPGFYVPESVVTSNQDLKKAMDAYISPDGHTAKITVILSMNPYSQQAIDAVPGIERAADVAFEQSSIHNGTIGLTGTTPTQSQLNLVSNADFVRTMSLILITIFILLAFMLRSVLAPIYILLSLTGTYFVTMGILQTIAVHILHKPGLSWTVPFFAFLLLVALGVDYCIFLMSRYDEELVKFKPRDAMQRAMSNMGNVVFSAAFIMAGTFGSMSVAGVTSLVEIGLAVIIGLLLYTFVILGLFIPACSAVIDRGHFWPFQAAGSESEGPRKKRLRAPRNA